MVRYRIKGKIEMRNAETINEIDCLTDSELHDVSGGHPIIVGALAVAVGWAWCGVVGGTWDLPLGSTKEQAAGALGLGHLL
jgi:hypothetical protein